MSSHDPALADRDREVPSIEVDSVREALVTGAVELVMVDTRKDIIVERRRIPDPGSSA